MSSTTRSTSASSVQAIMWYVYILLCDKKTFYVGMTNNLEERLSMHRDKRSFFTKKFSDLGLIYKENYSTKKEAAKREKQLKGWTHKKKQSLIEGKL